MESEGTDMTGSAGGPAGAPPTAAERPETPERPTPEVVIVLSAVVVGGVC